MRRTSITPGPVYGIRTPSPDRLAHIVHDRCKRNAIHLHKTKGWVIDIGRLRQSLKGFKIGDRQVGYQFDIYGFTKPCGRGAIPESVDQLLETKRETFSVDVYMFTDPTFDIEVKGADKDAPKYVLRCLLSTFNELRLYDEAMAERERR